ncbi:hypothetical protein EJ06DRAFT_580320 [Trichodelitschia bisporula]|uniref:Rhodopsin domain-containing protein n=1 Tax=Trichodelitschia bisporula TaxID=703511 RepID=A0A6G1I512_9PEZI|nr:hypothetical protein EJ06DRAFT_580320 [Trichodelitschia bisporula]
MHTVEATLTIDEPEYPTFTRGEHTLTEVITEVITTTPQPSFRPPYAALAPSPVGWSALGPSIAFSTAALLAVVVRWYTKVRLTPGGVRVEEYLVSGAMILSLVVTAVVGLEFHNTGVIHNAADFDATEHRVRPQIGKLVLVSNIFYCAATSLSKAAIVIQYVGIFHDDIYINLRRWCWLVVALITCSAAWGIFGGLFICHPVHKFWEPRTNGVCSSSMVYWVSFGVINTLLDYVVWITPMPVMRKLRLGRRLTGWVYFLGLLGGFICAVSTLRVVLVTVQENADEFTASGVSSATWSSVEADTGILCGSLLCIKPLLNKLCPRLLRDRDPPKDVFHLSRITPSGWRRHDSEEVDLVLDS